MVATDGETKSRALLAASTDMLEEEDEEEEEEEEEEQDATALGAEREARERADWARTKCVRLVRLLF